MDNNQNPLEIADSRSCQTDKATPLESREKQETPLHN